MAIAVDAMGGDSPLTVQIEAALQAISELGTEVILVGAEDQIKEVLKKHSFDQNKLRIVNSTETVAMNESPTTALRQKKNSSIKVAVDLLATGEADAVVSAGTVSYTHLTLPTKA